MKLRSFFILSISFAVFFSTNSCITTKPLTSVSIPYLPRDSFLKVEIKAVVNICAEKKVCMLNKREIVSGSGFVAANNSAGSFIITAAHLCDKEYFSNPLDHSETRYEFNALTIDKESFGMEILKYDTKTDICVLFARNLYRPPIITAREELIPGEKIYNIAAPRGVFFKNAPIIIDGIYNGYSEDGSIRHDLYTMLVAGGSSGSPILNQKGELVGMVSAMSIQFPFVVFSPKQDDLRKFYIRYILYRP